MLHKKRTGKAFHITKEIVEKEAMYEEIDERYQEKRTRMLQAQNMQIEEQFHRHLLAAFAARANRNAGSATPSIASRRSSMAPRASIDGTASSRKMSLDLSNLRSPFNRSMDSTSMLSPMTTSAGDSYMLSPSTTYDAATPSYITCMDGSESYSGMMPTATTATSSGQQAYVTQTPPPTWSVPMTTPAWAAMQQHVPTPNQTPTDSQAVQMWQQHMMQQAQLSNDATAIQMRQFRDRLASAPELPVQHAAAPPAPAASISGPSSAHGHSRGQSQPSNNFHNLNVLTQGTTHLSQMAPSSSHSPKIESLSAETQSTPSFCPTPNTPLSPTAIGTTQTVPAAKVEANDDGLMVSHEELDPDFNEFSQFALGLGNSSLPERDFSGFDEFVALDDYASVSC